MEFVLGLVLSLAVTGSATAIGLDRDRAFYPTLLIVIASYYVLFAAMGASGQTVIVESVLAGAFVLVAVIGFKTSLWLVATALVGHGVFDFAHHLLVENPGVPRWWPGFCLAVDVTAGGFLAVLLMKRSSLSPNPGQPAQ
jgi:hypothetical protein